jgi:hypothetical protein
MAEMDLSGYILLLYIVIDISLIFVGLVNLNSFVFVQVGLKGEALSLHSLSGSSSIEWGEPMQKQPLTWYKVRNKLACD